MSRPATHTPNLADAPRLLTVLPPYSPPRRPRPLPFRDTFVWLDLLTTILGAPRAVPPELWTQPLDADPKATLVAILRHVQNRIPLIEWEMVDFADSVEELSALHQIPIYPLGFDTCNGDIEGYGPATSLLAHLDGFEVPDLLWCPAAETVPDALNLAPLLPALDALPPPLNGIAVIVAMLHHTTGTILLDACPSCYAMGLDEMLEWTDDNLTWLEQDAALAERIHKRAFDLEAWVAQKPLARLKTIWQTIRRAHRAYLDAPPVYRGPFTISAEDFVAGKLPMPTRPKTLVELWADVPTEERHVPAPL